MSVAEVDNDVPNVNEENIKEQKPGDEADNVKTENTSSDEIDNAAAVVEQEEASVDDNTEQYDYTGESTMFDNLIYMGRAVIGR